MRDRSERVCSFSWDSDAELPLKDRSINLAIAPGEIQRADGEQFKEEPPVQRVSNEPPLNVKVLVNFAPQNSASAALQPVDTSALVSILRSISREPRIGKFSIVAFNMQEERVVYRQEGVDRIDFPALGAALGSLNLGTVDLKRLGEKHGDTEFLTGLVRKEVCTQSGTPRRPDFCRTQGHAGCQCSPGCPKGRGGRQFPGLLHELQPQSAGCALEGRDQPHGTVLPGVRIHHHTSSGFVVCSLRNGLAYCKIKEREADFVHLNPVGVCVTH